MVKKSHSLLMCNIGLYLDQQLYWKYHLNILYPKLNRENGMLSKLRSMLQNNKLKTSICCSNPNLRKSSNGVKNKLQREKASLISKTNMTRFKEANLFLNILWLLSLSSKTLYFIFIVVVVAVVVAFCILFHYYYWLDVGLPVGRSGTILVL